MLLGRVGNFRLTLKQAATLLPKVAGRKHEGGDSEAYVWAGEVRGESGG